MKFNYRKLRGRIVEMYGTLKEFAKAINQTEVSVYKKLRSQSYFNSKSMIIWAEALEIDLSEFGTYFCTKEV